MGENFETTHTPKQAMDRYFIIELIRSNPDFNSELPAREPNLMYYYNTIRVEWLPLEAGWLGGYNIILFEENGSKIGHYWKNDMDPSTGTLQGIWDELLRDIPHLNLFDEAQVMGLVERIRYEMLVDMGPGIARMARPDWLSGDFIVNGRVLTQLADIKIQVLDPRVYVVYGKQIAVHSSDKVTPANIAVKIKQRCGNLIDNDTLIDQIAHRIMLRIMQDVLS